VPKPLMDTAYAYIIKCISYTLKKYTFFHIYKNVICLWRDGSRSHINYPPPTWGSISWNLSLCAGKQWKCILRRATGGGGGRISARRTSDKFAAERAFSLSIMRIYIYMRAACAGNIMRWNKARGARGMIWWPGGTKCCWSLNSRRDPLSG
jgi:hypothetical protein